jgi:hypothetical protein
VSWRRQFLNDDVKKAFKEAFKRASNPQETGEAIDWMENLTPKRWKFGTEEKTYRW